MSAAGHTRFDELYRQHCHDVLAFLLRRTEQPADAADLLHDVFVVAWRRIAEVPDGTAARMWLFGVAHRQLANHRRGGRRRDRLVEALTEAATRAVAESSWSPHPGLHAALAQLSTDERAVVTLNAWEGLTPKDIATVLGVEPGTVRVRLHRARQRLREAMTSPSTARR